jgi:chemotaxis signal transduction protein
MSTSRGWLLKLGIDSFGVVGERELIHVLPYTPRLFIVPQTPEYCRQVMRWEDLLLPVMNLSARFGSNNEQPFADSTTELEFEMLVGIVAYRPDTSGNKIAHGALMLNRIPERVTVSDEQACDIPSGSRDWAAASLACFEHPVHGAMPILDLRYIFAAAGAV